MTRQRLVIGFVLAVALAACGGSSSETPPPLQPDPSGFHYSSAPPAVTEAIDAGDAPALIDPSDESEPKPRTPPHSTWGASSASR